MTSPNMILYRLTESHTPFIEKIDEQYVKIGYRYYPIGIHREQSIFQIVTIERMENEKESILNEYTFTKKDWYPYV
jgi:hypothetical protein